MEPNDKNEMEKILGQFLTAQSILYSLPTIQKLREFFMEALKTVPGIETAGLCIRGYLKPFVDSHENCQECMSSERLTDVKADFFCGFSNEADFWVIPLETSFQRYGFVQIKGDARQFKDYKPIIRNFANMLAITIENRRQREHLQKSNAELERNEKKFKSYFENSLSGVAIFDKEGKWVELNDKMCEITGYSREELLGFVWTDVTHPKDIAPCIHLIDEMKKNLRDQYTVEKRYVGRDGKITYVEASVGCVRNKEGVPEFYVALVQDITIKKKHEKELSEHRHHLEELVKEKTGEIGRLSIAINQALGGVVITDKNGMINFANPAFCENSGYSLDEIIGKKLNILNSGKHSREFFRDLWRTIVSGKKWVGEICNRKKNGELYWITQHIAPVKNGKGEITHFIGIRLDITQRKKDTEWLKAYAVELERSNSELQQFANIAYHDLQEPLRQVIVFGDRLKEKARNFDEASCDYINRIQKTTMNMQVLIDDLLSYSKITTAPKSFENIDLNQIIKEPLSNLEVRIARSRGKVRVEELPAIQADPSQIRQLFQNLIGNALKYHKAGEPPVVRIRGQHSGDEKIKIIVEDNGIGMEEKYVDKIFQPFQRLHGKNEYSGTGIGLAICKRIVDRHKGSITVESIVGEGSSFIISLPEKQSLV